MVRPARLLILVPFFLLASVEARAQADFLTNVTFYVVDEEGRVVNDVKIEPVEGAPDQRYPLTERYIKIVRDLDHKAYVLLHGLCSLIHRMVLKFSAPGFESTEQTLEIGGTQGYELNLKRKGSDQPATVAAIRCGEKPDRCKLELAWEK